jgi:hypothetical protein
MAKYVSSGCCKGESVTHDPTQPFGQPVATAEPPQPKTSRKRKILYGVGGLIVLSALLNQCSDDPASTTAAPPAASDAAPASVDPGAKAAEASKAAADKKAADAQAKKDAAAKAATEAEAKREAEAQAEKDKAAARAQAKKDAEAAAAANRSTCKDLIEDVVRISKESESVVKVIAVYKTKVVKDRQVRWEKGDLKVSEGKTKVEVLRCRGVAALSNDTTSPLRFAKSYDLNGDAFVSYGAAD